MGEKAGQLPLTLDSIGSHWSSHAHVDVVAINWKTLDILLGKGKWGTEAMLIWASINHGIVFLNVIQILGM